MKRLPHPARDSTGRSSRDERKVWSLPLKLSCFFKHLSSICCSTERGKETLKCRSLTVRISRENVKGMKCCFREIITPGINIIWVNNIFLNDSFTFCYLCDYIRILGNIPLMPLQDTKLFRLIFALFTANWAACLLTTGASYLFTTQIEMWHSANSQSSDPDITCNNSEIIRPYLY